MSEQFSDNVRAVLERSEAEASSRNLPEVSSELVLLALADIEGTAAHVLRALNITAERLFATMPVATSPKPTPRPIPFGQSAVHAVHGAHQEAARMGHEFIGTEHLLLGTLGEPSGRVAAALTRIGRDAIVARERLLDLLVSPGFVSPEAPRRPEKLPHPPERPVMEPSPLVDPPPPVEHRQADHVDAPEPQPVIDLRVASSSTRASDGPGVVSQPEVAAQSGVAAEPRSGVGSNGHVATPPTPWSSPAVTDSSAVITALLGELVLLRTEIAALRAEIVSMRSIRH